MNMTDICTLLCNSALVKQFKKEHCICHMIDRTHAYDYKQQNDKTSNSKAY